MITNDGDGIDILIFFIYYSNYFYNTDVFFYFVCLAK